MAREALARAAAFAPYGRPALFNGGVGAVVVIGGEVRGVVAFTVTGERIIAIDVIADPEKLSRLNVEV